MAAKSCGSVLLFLPRKQFFLLLSAVLVMNSTGCNKFFKKNDPAPINTPANIIDVVNVVDLVDAKIDLQLMMPGTDNVTDTEMMEALAKNCSQCHGTASNLDLTHIPPGDKLADIQWRVNLSATDVKRMPMSRSIEVADLAKINTWLKAQLSPSAATQFAGYQLKLSDPVSQFVYEVSSTGRGRFYAIVRQTKPNTRLTINVAVTSTSGGVLSNQTIDVEIDKLGYASKSIVVPAAETVPPVVLSPDITVSQLTQSSVNLKWAGATDGSSTAQIRYKVYRSDSANLDTSRDMELNGARVGDDVTAGPVFSADVRGLETYHSYYFNVLAEDEYGNKSAYSQIRVLTMPETICPEVTTRGGVANWRDSLTDRLVSDQSNSSSVVKEINRCFPREIPQCVTHAKGFALKDDVATEGEGEDMANMPQKRPPEELRDLLNPGDKNYWIPDNIEDVARQKGWTSVRYRTRHAGGFDSETPNLLMVYVPGDKVSPPVKFDRWLNFPLAVEESEADRLAPAPKTPVPTRAEYTSHGESLPKTFTMVSQDIAEEGKRSRVYFQMFFRGTPKSPTFTAGGPVSVRDGCVSCHPNGLRAISPIGYHTRAGEESLIAEDWKAVDLINRRMVEAAGGKAPLWGEGLSGIEMKPFYRAEFRGPVYGPARPFNAFSRTREFIMGGTTGGRAFEGCFKSERTIVIEDIFQRWPGVGQNNTAKLTSVNHPQINPDKVIAAMNCQGCHMDSTRAPLTGFGTGRLDTTLLAFKLLVDQSMPVGLHKDPMDADNHSGVAVDELTGDERIALYNCLKAEFQEEINSDNLSKWLRQDACSQ